MNQPLRNFALILCLYLVFAPASAHAQADTSIIRLDYARRPIQYSTDPYSFVLKVWQQPPLWGADLYTYPDNQRIYTCFYADSTRRILQGLYTGYAASGKISEQGMYENGKRQGRFEGWHENGQLRYVYHYNNGVLTDTNRRWNDAGKLEYQSVLNADGTGYATGMRTNPGFNESGPLLQGARHGEWTVKTGETLVMKMQYIKDSIAIAECYDSLGNVTNDPCIYERAAMFPGGNNGWRNYLQKNLRYPDEAKRNEIQGVVKIMFTVDKDGTLSDYSIVSSPHELLSKEVLRLMKAGPNWVPAIQYNRPVKMRHSQNVLFRLQ